MFKSITLDELINYLQEAREDYGGQQIVAFSSNYGDRCNTQQIHSLEGVVNESDIEETAYSNSGWAIRSTDPEDDDEEDGPQVLIIS